MFASSSLLLRLTARALLPLSLLIAGGAQATPLTIDVIFAIDNTGSTTTTEFATEKALAKTIHDQFIGLNRSDLSYRFGVIDFARGVRTDLTLNQPYNASVVANLAYHDTDASGSNVKGALQAGIDMFNQYARPGELRQIFMFSDGRPNPASSGNGFTSADLTDASVNLTVLTLPGYSNLWFKNILADSKRDVIDYTKYKATDTTAIVDRLVATAAVPEPGALSLVALGLGAAFLVRRRKRG